MNMKMNIQGFEKQNIQGFEKQKMGRAIFWRQARVVS